MSAQQTERERAARELAEAERSFQLLRAAPRFTPEQYATVRARLQLAQQWVEALLERGW